MTFVTYEGKRYDGWRIPFAYLLWAASFPLLPFMLFWAALFWLMFLLASVPCP